MELELFRFRRIVAIEELVNALDRRCQSLRRMVLVEADHVVGVSVAVDALFDAVAQDLEEALDSYLASVDKDLVSRFGDAVSLVLSYLLIDDLLANLVASECHEINARARKVGLEVSLNECAFSHSWDAHGYQYHYGVVAWCFP